MLIDCLIWLIIYVIVAVIFLYVAEMLIRMVAPDLPANVFMLIRLLVALLLLLWLLSCVGLLGGGASHTLRWHG